MKKDSLNTSEDIHCPICKSTDVEVTPLGGIFLSEVVIKCLSCGFVSSKVIEPLNSKNN